VEDMDEELSAEELIEHKQKVKVNAIDDVIIQ